MRYKKDKIVVLLLLSNSALLVWLASNQCRDQRISVNEVVGALCIADVNAKRMKIAECDLTLAGEHEMKGWSSSERLSFLIYVVLNMSPDSSAVSETVVGLANKFGLLSQLRGELEFIMDNATDAQTKDRSKAFLNKLQNLN